MRSFQLQEDFERHPPQLRFSRMNLAQSQGTVVKFAFILNPKFCQWSLIVSSVSCTQSQAPKVLSSSEKCSIDDSYPTWENKASSYHLSISFPPSQKDFIKSIKTTDLYPGQEKGTKYFTSIDTFLFNDSSKNWWLPFHLCSYMNLGLIQDYRRVRHLHL